MSSKFNLSQSSHKKAYFGIGFFGVYLLIAFIVGNSISGTEYGLSLLMFAIISIAYACISFCLGSFWFLFNTQNLEILYNEILLYCGIDGFIGTQALFYPIVIIFSLMNLFLILILANIIALKVNEGINRTWESMKSKFSRE